jgi:hypothetical protein
MRKMRFTSDQYCQQNSIDSSKKVLYPCTHERVNEAAQRNKESKNQRIKNQKIKKSKNQKS